MLRQVSATLLCVAVLTLSQCTSDKNLVSVAHTNFTGEIERDQNLVFTFNKKLTPDSLLNKWDTSHYISFTPFIKGKFKWTGQDELIFSPEEPFMPSTDYKAVLNREIAKNTKGVLHVNDEKPILFHTPYLNMLGTQLFYALSRQNTNLVQVRINLNFNCKVRPSVLQKLLHVNVSGTNVPFDMVSTDADNMLAISIPEQQQSSKDKIPVTIHIDKGFTCVGSGYQSKDPIEVTAELPVKDKLMVTEMTASFINGQGIVNVLTNQPIVSEGIEDNIKVDPAVTLKIENTESGLQLSGDFQPSKTYRITLSHDMKGIFGGAMGSDYTDEVSFGELKPMIEFASKKAMYLSSAGEKNIAVNIAGIQKVKITVSRVYENNIMEFIRSGNSEGYHYRGEDEDGGRSNEDEDYSYGSSYQYYNLENYGDDIYHKTYDVTSLPKMNNMRLLNLALEDLDYSSSFKGIYVVKVEDTEHRWLQSSTIISLSDIGIIAKQGQNKMMVFANSILNANALSGVRIDFISTNNQKVFSAVTDNAGVAVLDDMPAKLGKFRVGMVTCRSGQDFNFMILNNTRVETSRYEVGGKTSNEAHIDAFLYGDRDLYRPGDSIHINTIVRSDDWKVQKDIPVKFKLMLPNGKEYQSARKTLNEQGATAIDFYLPTSIITGSFGLQLLSANDVLLASKTIGVEEFMPDRIKVTVNLDKEQYKPSENMQASIKAENYFGPPAADRNYELNLNLTREEFSAKKFNQYIFRLNTTSNPFESVTRNGKTDAEGNIKESFPLPAYKDYGLLRGNLYTTVFDETGRPVNRNTNFEIVTQDVFYGIKDFDSWINTHSNITIQFVALNVKKAPVAAEAQVEIYRYRWETILERRGGWFQYNSQKREQLLYTTKLEVGANGSTLPFTPNYSGDYEVRIRRPGAESYVAKRFYAYGWGDTDNSSFEVSNEGEVIMETDKEQYAVGDKAKVLLKTPFNGKVLITVERGDVYEYYYKETDNKSTSVTIDLKEEYLPNVYITATAIRSINGPSLPLTVARGFIPVKVEKTAYKIPVSIIAKENVRSKTTQTITVKSVPGAQVTIAAVDEGILAIRDYKSPDPYGYFYSQRALDVSSFDLYPFLFPELKNHLSSVGGDEEVAKANMGKRVNPLTSKRVVLLAKWSGILKPDGNGMASYTINIPQFSGSVRIMAVAYKDKSFGSAEKNMTVADPVVISTALPRFTSPGDSLTVPVTLSNTTAQAANLTATITAVAPLYIVGAASQTLQVKANSEARVVFKIAAQNVTGISNVTVSVSDGREKYTDVTEISCRPLSSLLKIDDAGIIKGGESKSVVINAAFIPSTMDAKLIVSKSPLVQFTKNLNYLLEYPYGCVEQTVSTAFPQLYFNDLAAAIGQKGPKRYNPDYNVREAIKKLESMQLYNGAFSYWPGGDYESWWGTAYAVHFLFEADKAGFDVNKTILDKALSYLQFKVRNHEMYDYYYWDDYDHALHRTVLKREIAYSLYVMALAGRYDVSTLNFCKSNPELLTIDSKYMIACCYALSGNQINYKAMLPAEFRGELSRAELAGSFCSPIRDESIALNCLLETNPDDPQVGVIAMHLSGLLKKEYWLNTQETSFSLLALGKVARRAAKSNVTASVMVNGQSIGQYSNKDLVIDKGIAGKTLTIQTSGSGNLYYSWELEGISNTGAYVEEDKNLQVRRTYYDRYGNVITGNTFKQNDLIVVKLSLWSSIHDESVPNVAITDLLPAGFEIENPRISSVPELTWIKDASNPDCIDIRDDRINLFSTAYPSVRNYYYIVRAVSKGRFKQGPVHADAMYSMNYHSYNGAGVIIVK